MKPYTVPQKKCKLRTPEPKKIRIRGEKKRTNKPTNPKFKWMREEIPECLICGAPGEIHHTEFGCHADDASVVMLCLDHHSAQSNAGVHKDPKAWYDRFIPLAELQAIAQRIDDDYNEIKERR